MWLNASALSYLEALLLDEDEYSEIDSYSGTYMIQETLFNARLLNNKGAQRFIVFFSNCICCRLA